MENIFTDPTPFIYFDAGKFDLYFSIAGCIISKYGKSKFIADFIATAFENNARVYVQNFKLYKIRIKLFHNFRTVVGKVAV